MHQFGPRQAENISIPEPYDDDVEVTIIKQTGITNKSKTQPQEDIQPQLPKKGNVWNQVSIFYDVFTKK